MYNGYGKIFNIQRFSASDGPGIRTVVFFKGCPLNCAWCHNPESKKMFSEIFYNKDMCIHCGACVHVCPDNNHELLNKTHIFRRTSCHCCGACTKACPSDALQICGENKTTEDVMAVVLRDKAFYTSSGGGMTVSGGEPFMQYDFTMSLLKCAKAHGLHTAVETSGFTLHNLEEAAHFTDVWLYDIKLLKDEEHIKYTGVSNKKIRENLKTLNRMGANIILRCPIIPHVNFSKSHFSEITALANELPNVTAIHLEPYHPLGISKAAQLDKTQQYQNNTFLEKSLLTPFADKMQVETNKPVTVL